MSAATGLAEQQVVDLLDHGVAQLLALPSGAPSLVRMYRGRLGVGPLPKDGDGTGGRLVTVRWRVRIRAVAGVTIGD